MPRSLAKGALVVSHDNINGNDYYITIAAAVRDIHGDRGDPAGKHVNCHDGQHLSEDRRDQKRMAETSTSS